MRLKPIALSSELCETTPPVGFDLETHYVARCYKGNLLHRLTSEKNKDGSIRKVK